MPKLTLDYRNATNPIAVTPSPIQKFLSKRWVPWAFMLMIVLTGVGLWLISCLFVHEAHAASPKEVARLTSILPPPEARNLMAASADPLAPGFTHFVRFEAPPDVCLSYASAVLKGAPLGPPRQFDRSVCQDEFWRKSWFDLDKATNLVGGSLSPDVTVWVDKDRGVFYFMEIN